MDNGVIFFLILVIVFAIIVLITFKNDEKVNKNTNSTIKNLPKEQTNTLMEELLNTIKSLNQKVNIIMWLMLIPIIINVVLIFLAIFMMNETIIKLFH